MNYSYDRIAKEFASPEAMKDYLREHPNADPRKHYVKKEDGGLHSGPAKVKTKVDKGVADSIGKVWKNKPSGNAVDAVRNMIEKGEDVSINMLNKAVGVLKNHAKDPGTSKEDAKALNEIRRKLKDHAKMKQASTSYTYDRRTAEEKTQLEQAEKGGEWNLHLMKDRSKWRYSMVNPHGGSFSTGSYGSQQAATNVALKGVDWKKYGGGKTRVWTIVSEWTGDDWMPKKTFWTDIPTELLEKERKPLTKEELDDLRGR